MKNIVKKLVSTITTLAIATGTIALPLSESTPNISEQITASAEGETKTAGKFKYTIEVVNNQKVARINQYTGKSRKVVVPAKVNGIKVFAIDTCTFYNKKGIENIVISNGISYIGSTVFDNCKNLKSITIPDSVHSMGGNSFSGTALRNKKVNGVVYADKWVVDCDSKVTSVTLKKGTVGISNHAFDNAKKLKKISIPDSVKYVGCEAFVATPLYQKQKTTVKYADKWVVGCDYNAKSVKIKNGVTGIADYAFEHCEKLKSLEVPKSVSRIGAYAFYLCNINTLKILNKNIIIEDFAFVNEQRTLKKIYFNGTKNDFLKHNKDFRKNNMVSKNLKIYYK